MSLLGQTIHFYTPFEDIGGGEYRVTLETDQNILLTNNDTQKEHSLKIGKIPYVFAHGIATKVTSDWEDYQAGTKTVIDTKQRMLIAHRKVFAAAFDRAGITEKEADKIILEISRKNPHVIAAKIPARSSAYRWGKVWRDSGYHDHALLNPSSYWRKNL